MQIDHDPKEKRPKVGMAAVLITSLLIGGGLALSRADWDALANSDESPIWAVVAIAGFGLLFVAVHFALKGWDRLWAKITARR